MGEFGDAVNRWFGDDVEILVVVALLGALFWLLDRVF